jgi:hypothetical protein
MLRDDSGPGAMLRAGRWLEDVVGLQVVFVGRAALDRKDCYTLEVSGQHLAYTLKVDGNWIFLSVQALDGAAPPELLLRAADGSTGWTQATKLVAAFERSGVRTLQVRPIELGEPGNSDSWAIG